MAKSKASARSESPDWGTAGKRIEWLLNTRFTGNRSELARSIGFSHAAISRVVSGQKPPGRQMLTAIVEKLGVDAEWLLSGNGEPFGIKPDAQDVTVWMPVTDQLLPAPLAEELRGSFKRSVGVPGLRPSTQYWFRLRGGEPILGDGKFGFLKNDLLLMETNPAKFPTPESFLGEVCAVKCEPEDRAPVKLGAVDYTEDSEVTDSGLLQVDTFERQPEYVVEEFVFRRHPNGDIEASERRCRPYRFRGGTFYTDIAREDVIGPPLRRIHYKDIVAIWTGILYRPYKSRSD